MESLKLYMLLVGCKPAGRNTEQHDVFFSIGTDMIQIVPHILEFWPEANETLHLDAWRNVAQVGGYDIKIERKANAINPYTGEGPKLFFINLGGYKINEFEEFHYKMLVAASNKSQAIKEAKQSAFYRHTGFKGAQSHVDDKYGIDVDDVYEIADILPAKLKDSYTVSLTGASNVISDDIHLGYIKLDTLSSKEHLVKL